MSQDDTEKWLKEVIAKIIDNLGPDIEEVQQKLSQPTDAIMSSRLYVRVRFRNKLKKTEDEEISLVLKRCAQTDAKISQSSVLHR